MRSTTPRRVKPEPEKRNVIYSVPERILISVTMLTVESADGLLMHVLVAVRAGTCLRTARITGVRLEVMLNLGLIHRVQQ